MLVVPVSLRPTFSNRSREGWELRTFTDLVVLGSSMLTMISCGAARALRTWLAAATLAATAFLPVAVKADTSAFPPPVVVVYPFTVSGTMDPEAGGNIAVLLSTRLASLGGITVKPYTPGTERHDFLIAAQRQNADYYVTGFVTPLGSEASLVTQVVSIYAGTVVWSNTTTIRTYADALAQSDGLRAAIVSHAQRNFASIGATTGPAPTPEPATSDAAGVNLTRALGRKHRNAASAPTPVPSQAPSPAPTAAAVAAIPKPAVPSAPGVLVTDVGGNADPELRTRAANALSAAFRRHGFAGGGLGVSGRDALANAAQLCKANPGSVAIYIGTLTADASAPNVALDVAKYDCAGQALGMRHDAEIPGRRLPVANAVDLAAGKIADAFAKAAP